MLSVDKFEQLPPELINLMMDYYKTPIIPMVYELKTKYRMILKITQFNQSISIPISESNQRIDVCTKEVDHLTIIIHSLRKNEMKEYNIRGIHLDIQRCNLLIEVHRMSVLLKNTENSRTQLADVLQKHLDDLPMLIEQFNSQFDETNHVEHADN